MPTINSSIVPYVPPGALFTTLAQSPNYSVRWLTARDPLYYEVLNRPIADMAFRQLVIAKSIDRVNLCIAWRAKYPFIIQPVMEGIDIPLNWFWDMHVTIPEQFYNLRLTRLQRIDGHNIGTLCDPTTTNTDYTGHIRLVFSADIDEGTSAATYDLFTVTYKIDSELEYQRLRVVPVTADEGGVLVPSDSDYWPLINGQITFITMDQDQAEVRYFYDSLPPAVTGITTKYLGDSPPNSVAEDVIHNGTGVLTDVAYNLDNGSSIIIQDEGIVKGSVSALNFTGDGVTATVSGDVATIAVTGGGGGGGLVECGAEKKFVNILTTAAGQTSFTLTDDYNPGTHDLVVYRNGKRLTVGEYIETSANVVTLANAALSGDVLTFVVYKTPPLLYEKQVATAGQTVFNLSGNYAPGTNQLRVYRNGKKLVRNYTYSETSSNTVTLANPALAGDVFEFVSELYVWLYELHIAVGGQTVFSTAKAYSDGTGNVEVFRNGKRLTVGTEYTETDDNTITLANAAYPNDEIEIIESGTQVYCAVSSLTVKDEGTTQTTATDELDFVGDGVQASSTGAGKAKITIPGLTVQDEGTDVVAGATKINFVGSGVTATDSGGGTVTVAISGGGGVSSCADMNSERQVATANQTVFNLTSLTYDTSKALLVVRNGQVLDSNAYTKTSSSSVTLNSGAQSGDVLEFYVVDCTLSAGDCADMSSERQVATANQTVFNLTSLTYDTSKSILVIRNGQVLDSNAYVKTSGSSVTLNSAAQSGDVLEFYAVDCSSSSSSSECAYLDSERQVAIANQKLFNLSSVRYDTSKSLLVVRNGQILDNNAYQKTSDASVTLNSGAQSGDVLEFYVAKCETSAPVVAGGCAVMNSEKQTASANQSVFNLTQITYDTTKALIVTLNGQVLDEGMYTKTSSSVVTLNFGAQSGDVLEFYTIDCVSTQDAIAWHLFNNLTIGQTVLNLPFSYTVGAHHLFVVRNGAELIVNDPGSSGYTETTTTSITLNTPVSSTGERIVVYKLQAVHSSLNHTMAFHDDAAAILAPGQTYRNLRVDCFNANQVMIQQGTHVLDDTWVGSILFNNNVTVDITTSGKNGLDAGSEVASAWYYVYAIYNPTSGEVAGLLSASATNPTMPTGFTQKRLISAVRNDSSSNFVTYTQRGDLVSINGAKTVLSGAPANTNWAGVSLSSFVPVALTREVNFVGNMYKNGSYASNSEEVHISSFSVAQSPADGHVVVGSSSTYANGTYTWGNMEIPIRSTGIVAIRTSTTLCLRQVNVVGYTLEL